MVGWCCSLTWTNGFVRGTRLLPNLRPFMVDSMSPGTFDVDDTMLLLFMIFWSIVIFSSLLDGVSDELLPSIPLLLVPCSWYNGFLNANGGTTEYFGLIYPYFPFNFFGLFDVLALLDELELWIFELKNSIFCWMIDGDWPELLPFVVSMTFSMGLELCDCVCTDW